MGHYIEQTSTIQWHVAVYVACMVSTCLFNIAFAYKDLQGQGEEWSMENVLSMKKHVQHSMHLENSKESCKQLLVLKTLFFGRNIPAKILVPHLPREVHPSHPILGERFPINPPIHWGSISCEFRPWSLRKPRRIRCGRSDTKWLMYEGEGRQRKGKSTQWL